MGKGQAAVDIDRSADRVWAVVGDFGGLAGWMPGIESCRTEGDDRILATMGMEITERLVAKDDDGRVLTYSIVDGVPIEHHQGVVTVTPTGGGEKGGESAHVTWDVDAAPDEMVGVMVGMYQQALDALKARLEG